jgi:hypothetical protein
VLKEESFLFTFLNSFEKSQIQFKRAKKRKNESAPKSFNSKIEKKNIKKMKDDLKVL